MIEFFAHPQALAFLTLAQAATLLAWWYLPVIIVAFAGWAWVVAKIYDNDAQQYFLAREKWNTIHVLFGTGAIFLVIVLPVPGFITVPAMIALLVGDLVWYFMARNADERVPASAAWSLSLAGKFGSGGSKKSKDPKGSGVSKIIFKGPNGELPVPDRQDEQYEIRVTAEEFIQRMSDVRGSQLDITPTREGTYLFSTLVDGVRQPIEQVQPQQAVAILDVYKTAAGLDINDRRRKQQGFFKMGPPSVGAKTEVRVTTIGDAKSIRLTLLVDPEGQVQRRTKDLGFLPIQLEDIEKLTATNSGVVLVVSPPDNGRTSTLYALIRESDAYLNNIQTIEIEPQAEIEGVRVNQYNPVDEGAEYSTTVRSIVRRDPSIVAIAEMPDEDTAKVVSKAEHDRTRCYLSFNCDNAMAALQVYAKSVGDQKLAALSLYGIIAQRLARRLCTQCRIQFQPSPEMLKKIGLPPDTKQLYRKSGQILIKDKPHTCEVCGGSGFFGQVGVFEVYPFDDQDRLLIASNDLTTLRARIRKAKRPSIQASALQHAINGETSIEEVVRVTAPPKKSKPKPTKAPPKDKQPTSA